MVSERDRNDRLRQTLIELQRRSQPAGIGRVKLNDDLRAEIDRRLRAQQRRLGEVPPGFLQPAAGFQPLLGRQLERFQEATAEAGRFGRFAGAPVEGAPEIRQPPGAAVGPFFRPFTTLKGLRAPLPITGLGGAPRELAQMQAGRGEEADVLRFDLPISPFDIAIELIPGVGLAPFAARTVTRLGGQVVRRGATEALVRMPSVAAKNQALKIAGVKPVAGGAGSAKGEIFDLDSLEGIDKAIKTIRRRIREAEELKEVLTVREAGETIEFLEETRRAVLAGKIGEEGLARLDEAEQALSFAKEELAAWRETRISVPRFGTVERSEFDAARMQARQAGQRVIPKAQAIREAQGRVSRLTDEVNDLRQGREHGPTLEEISERAARARPTPTVGQVVPPPPTAPIRAVPEAAAPALERQVGQVQPGFGIGERPSQGQLLGEFRGEGQAVPLRSVEQETLRQLRLAEVRAGQQVLPEQPPAGVGRAAEPPVRPPVPPIEGVPPPPTMPPSGPIVPPPPSGPRIMGDLSPVDQAIEDAVRPDTLRRVANLPGIRTIMGTLNPASVASSPAHKAIIGRAVLRNQGEQLSQVATARLEQLGTQSQVFGKLTPDGLLAEGPFKGVTVNTIRAFPGRYASRMTPEQRAWVQAAKEIEDAKLAYLQENGILVRELTFEEGGEYAGRRVYAKITQSGEMVDAAFVGAGPGRPGAKLAVEKHRFFNTAEEAIAAGYRYIPEDEALILNVKGAYNRVADKRMSDWLLLQVPWRTTAAPDNLKIAAFQAKQLLNRSRQLKAALNRAVRGERLPTATINSIRAAYPEEAARLEALVSRLQGKAPQTASEVKGLTARANELIAEAQVRNAEAVSARAAARERAIETGFEEARIQAPAFAGKIFTGPEARETARILREAMEPGFSKALGAINQVNAISRFFMLAGDLSTATIQLLYLAGANPRVYAGAIKGLLNSIVDTRFQARYLAMPENIAIMQKYPELILTRGGTTEFTEAMARGGLLRKGPLKLGAKVLEPFQRGFEGSLDVAGIEMAKSLDHLGTTASRRSDLAQFINEFRGVTSSARLGVSTTMRQVETATILAPRYNRAIAALLTDTLRGGLRGNLARQSLARGILAVAAVSAVISWARGESEEEILGHLNPASPTFMTWKVGDQNIGPGSKLRSVLRLVALSAKDPEKLLDTSVGWGAAEYIRNPVIKFARGLTSPGVSLAWDFVTGKDFIGDPTRDSLLSFSKAIAENFMPIWSQTVALEGGTVQGRATRGLAEFGGMRAYPRNLIWELRDDQKELLDAYEAIPTDRLDLGRGEPSRIQFRRRNPETDAVLFIVGDVTSLQSPQAVREAARLVQEHGLDAEEIRGIAERKEQLEKAAQSGQGLEPNEIDALLRLLNQPGERPVGTNGQPQGPLFRPADAEGQPGPLFRPAEEPEPVGAR